MILVNELRGRMIAKGYTQARLANALKISNVTLSRKLRSGIFLSSEIEKMVELLDIKDPCSIFFAPEVACKANCEK